MSWERLFDYCWNSQKEVHIRVNDYIVHPDKLDTIERVKYYEESAARTIKEMEEYIAQLQGYRNALAERYAALASMPYTYRLELIRHKGWHDKKVTYTIQLLKVFQDGHEEVEEKTTYPGTERRQALKDYEAMKKSRPGIETKVDIEKARWECYR